MSASPATELGAIAEVRLRYRPAGDVLTVSVRTTEPRTGVERCERGDVVVESSVLPDGSRRLRALQLLDALRHCAALDVGTHLPGPLVGPALDLVDPGRRHHGHPSTHRPSRPTSVHETTLAVPLGDLLLPSAVTARGAPTA